ncbi:UPF0236 family transposase-like protein [Fusobacterium sp. PH5-44]|uniref:UPF0236 family transposase-like protein n=1 Tax=unclassified Fusobacterium TaxID=2648384 RepID=UPI003D21ADFC
MHGCSAEGQVSHVLLSRLKSRALGWSEHGLDIILKLSVYKYNGGDIRELLKTRELKIKKKLK